MVFIDGAYLRKIMRDLFDDDKIDWAELRNFLVEKVNESAEPFTANLVRIYYYDAQVAHGDPQHKPQSAYFDKIKLKKQYSLRLGQAVRGSEGELRQKGVDILIAIDTLSKAYQNHFDTAIFLVGDRDFLPLIKAVKDTGKKIHGFYYTKATALELRLEFDFRHPLTKRVLRRLRMIE